MEDLRYKELRGVVRDSFSPLTQRMVDEAIEFAKEQLQGELRYDNTPMLDHSIGAALIVIKDIGLGRNSTIATILHDVVRISHKRCSNEEFLSLLGTIRERFGEEVVGITMGMCSISELKLKHSDDQAGNLRDMIVAYSSDARVILIKLADRLEVMRSLDMFPSSKRKKKSWESMNLYAQIAHKLGLYAIKSELEDIALRYLEPKSYEHITKKLEESSVERERFVERFLSPIKGRLDALKIKYHIKGRTKSIYSIYSKMTKQGVPFEGVYDIFAIRIIIDCEPNEEKMQCWSAYSVVTDLYTPNPKRLRDWLSIPKSNGYESLHTTVSAEGEWVEVQIRSDRMDAIAERGIAAHWRYKGVNQSVVTSDMWLSRLREVLEDNAKMTSTGFDAKPTQGEVFVFTPNGDLRKLPQGSTLLDFAFDIHTSLGMQCVGGRVNQRAVPIREVLQNGDIIEIQTQKNQTPKADWLSFVVTTKARSKIKSFIRDQKAIQSRLGREELERKIKNWKLSLPIDEVVSLLSKHYKVKLGVELYAMIATKKIEFATIKSILLRHISGEADEERRAAAAELDRKKELLNSQKSGSTTERKGSNDALIIDDDISRIKYKLARCCNPIKGDSVFGFITIGGGITIHRGDCPNASHLREEYPYRIIEAQWRSGAEGAFVVTLRIVAADIVGIANHIIEVVSRDLKLNIRSLSFDTARNGAVAGNISVEVEGSAIVDQLIHSLLRIKGVQRAYRVK